MYKHIFTQCNDIQLFDFYKDGKKMLFPAWNINGFFSYEENSECIELISMLPGSVLSNAQYIKYFKIGNELIWIPYHSSNFLFYNLDTKKVKTFPVDNDKCMTDVSRFCNACYVNGKIYCCPGKAHSFVEYDVNEDRYLYYCIDEELSSELYNAGIEKHNFIDGVLVNNKIYVLADKDNVMVSFDVMTKKINLVHSKLISKIVKLLVINETLCLVLSDGGIYEYCDEGNAINKINDLQCIVETDDYICTNDNMIIFHKNKNNQLIQITQKGIKSIISYEKILLDDEYLAKAKLKIIGNNIYILPNRGNVYIKLDMSTGNLEKHRITMTNSIVDEYLCKILSASNNKGKIWETKEFDETFYIEMIKRNLL